MSKITKHAKRKHSKASETYIDVTFVYESGEIWEGSIPVEYRRTGIELTEEKNIDGYLEKVYAYCQPARHEEWEREQEKFWSSKPKATVTKSFFDTLLSFSWTCRSCQMPPNPNFARRIQDLKEMGYTIATYPAKRCHQCGQKTTHLLLIPLPRGGISGYETWSPDLRRRIVEVLDGYDAYEGKKGKKDNLLPDHKFPEIRWGKDTKRGSLENLADDEIREDFQLLSNQRNLQKREVCRKCYQANTRGHPFGIKYYYRGNENWPANVPKYGKAAEEGCVGCGWYDLEKWRVSLNQNIANLASN